MPTGHTLRQPNIHWNNSWNLFTIFTNCQVGYEHAAMLNALAAVAQGWTVLHEHTVPLAIK